MLGRTDEFSGVLSGNGGNAQNWNAQLKHISLNTKVNLYFKTRHFFRHLG